MLEKTPQLEQAIADYKSARDLFHSAKFRLKQLIEDLNKKNWPLEVGDIVRDASGKEFLVRRVERGDPWIAEPDLEPNLERKPWVIGSPRNKDGKFGKRRVSLFSNWYDNRETTS